MGMFSCSRHGIWRSSRSSSEIGVQGQIGNSLIEPRPLALWRLCSANYLLFCLTQRRFRITLRALAAQRPKKAARRPKDSMTYMFTPGICSPAVRAAAHGSVHWSRFRNRKIRSTRDPPQRNARWVATFLPGKLLCPVFTVQCSLPDSVRRV